MAGSQSGVAAASRLYVPEPCTLIEARPVTATERWLRLRRANGRPLGHTPGQFVQVSLFGVGEAPFSVVSAGAGRDDFELCVRRLGRLTSALHRLEPGQTVGVRGPYGRGFRTAAMEGRDVLFVAGGLGMAPLRALVEHCLAARERFGRLVLLYGARTPADLLFTDDLERWPARGLEVRLTVDRPDASWAGAVGLITALLDPLEVDPARTVAAVCGPPVMYRFVLERLAAKGLPPESVQVSLERQMRCGVGKCGHCAMGDLLVCTDGPVFTWAELRAEREALA